MKLPNSYIHVLKDFNIPLYNSNYITDINSTTLKLQGGEILLIKWMESPGSTKVVKFKRELKINQIL